jgi:tetratricopeptide (TPR) repeat protein
VHAARFLRRRERLDEAASLLWDSGLLPSPEIRRPSTPEAQAESDAGPILAEWGRLELERALNQEGADPAARVDIARRYLEKARAVALTARPEDPEAAHQADTYLAGLHFARGDAAEALAVLEKAIRRAESSGMRALAVDGYRLRMSARFELGENSSAMGDLLSAVKLAKTIGYPDLEAEVLAEQAGVEEKLGNREKATRLKVEAEQLRQLR